MTWVHGATGVLALVVDACHFWLALAVTVKLTLHFFNIWAFFNAGCVAVSDQWEVTLASLPVVLGSARGPQGAGVSHTQPHTLPLGVSRVDVVTLLVGGTLVVCAAPNLNTVVVWVALESLRADAECLVEVDFAIGSPSADLVQAGINTFIVDAGLRPWAVTVLRALVLVAFFKRLSTPSRWALTDGAMGNDFTDGLDSAGLINQARVLTVVLNARPVVWALCVVVTLTLPDRDAVSELIFFKPG